jgi:hypothetical protein
LTLTKSTTFSENNEEIEAFSPIENDQSNNSNNKNNSGSAEGKEFSPNISKVFLKQLLKIKNIEVDSSEKSKLRHQGNDTKKYQGEVIGNKGMQNQISYKCFALLSDREFSNK